MLFEFEYEFKEHLQYIIEHRTQWVLPSEWCSVETHFLHARWPPVVEFQCRMFPDNKGYSTSYFMSANQKLVLTYTQCQNKCTHLPCTINYIHGLFGYVFDRLIFFLASNWNKCIVVLYLLSILSTIIELFDK